MTEIQFAKQFLTTLDSKPTRYSEDHIFDPQTFQTRTPYTLPKLSHPPHPLLTKAQGTATSSSSSIPTASTINVTLKSNRNPTFTLHLPSLPTTTPISTLRTQVHSLLSQSHPTAISSEKIKILQNKRPVPANKSTIHDVLADSAASTGKESIPDIEFGVMIMGGAADPNPTTQTLNLNNDIEPVPTEVGPESEKAAATVEAKSTATTARGNQVSSPDPVKSTDLKGKDVLGTREFWDDLQGFLEQRLRSSEVAQEVRALFEKAVR